jgi:hypothetical protein
MTGYHGTGALNGGSPFPLYGPTKQALLSPALPTLECSMRSKIIESIILVAISILSNPRERMF